MPNEATEFHSYRHKNGERKMYRIKIRRVTTVLDLGIIIMCIKVMLSGSALFPYSDLADTALTAVAVVLFVASIVYDRYSRLTLWGYILFGLFSLYSVIISSNYGFFISIIVFLNK